MDECDTSTANIDCWHSAYGDFFLQVWPGPFPDFQVGPGNEASFVVLTAMWKGVAGVSGVQ